MTASPLLRWFRSRPPRRVEHRIEAALMSRKLLGYCLWRLRYVALSGLLALLVPVLEYAALRKAFGVLHVRELFVMHVLGVAALGGVWGSLHGYRARLRDAWLGQGRSAALRMATETVSRVGMASAVLAYAACVVFALVAVGAPQLTERGAYMTACVLRLAVGATLQAFHSTVFSIMRVRRPLWAFRIGDAVGLSALLLFPSGGPWVQVVRVLVVTALSAIAASFFLRRSWQQLRLPRLRLRRQVWARWTPPWRDAIDAALGAGLRAIHLLLVGAILSTWGTAAQARGSVLVFFAAPALGLAAAWPSAFYFDLSRTARGPVEAHLHGQLVTCLRRLAPVLGLMCGGTGALLLHAANLSGWGFQLGYLVPLGACIAALSTELTLALCERRWVLAILRLAPLMAAPFVGPMVFGRVLSAEGAALPLSLALLTLVALPITPPRVLSPKGQPLVAAAWRSWTHAMPESQVVLLHVPARAESGARTRAYVLASELATEGWSTTTDGERVLLARSAQGSVRTSSLAVRCAGLARHVRVARTAAQDLDALLADWLGVHTTQAQAQDSPLRAFGATTVHIDAPQGPTMGGSAAAAHYRQAVSDALGRSAPAHQQAFGHAPAGALASILIARRPLTQRVAQRIRGSLWSDQLLGRGPTAAADSAGDAEQSARTSVD